MSESADELFHQALLLKHDHASPEETQQAAALYQRAAELGHAQATFILANMHRNGELGEPDMQKAAKLYQQAAKLGDHKATFNLALMHYNGEFGEPNKQKAAELYRQAANRGDYKGAFNLALMYHKGELGEPNKQKAAELYQQATNLGHALAALLLANMHRKGELGLPDKKKAAELYRQAADLGNASAAFNLALMYEMGEIGESGTLSANEWFKRAHKLGNPTAQLFLPYSGITSLTNKISISGIKEKLELALRSLSNTFFDIRRKHLLDEDTPLSHFTSWKTLESMLPVNTSGETTSQRNVLRQYHVDYMNDPKEGYRLLDFKSTERKANKVSTLLKTLFNKEYHEYQRTCPTNYELLPSVFICSLTLDSDRLDLWRAYGNDGDGYCLTFAFDGSRQASSKEAILNRANQEVFYTEYKADEDRTPAQQESIDDKPTEANPPLLYKIHYTDKDITDTLEKLHDPLAALEKLKRELENDELRNELDACMASMLLELLYLYKDEQYANEREVRAVRMLPLNHADIRSDERTPGRLYIETQPFLLTTNSSITVGPKVPGKDQLAAIWNLRWRLTKHGFDKTSKVVLSQVAYR